MVVPTGTFYSKIFTKSDFECMDRTPPEFKRELCQLYMDK